MPETKTTDAPALPDFQAGVSYDVTMLKAVEFPPGTGNWLRPDQSVTLEGSVARSMKDAIGGAVASPT